jgi:uncharacterized membrane protein
MEGVFQVSTAKSKSAALAAPTSFGDWPRVAAIVLCLVGILVAGYMAWAELTGNETVCSDAGNIDCAAVQESAYAKTIGFPVAVMGLLGFVAMLGVLVLEDQVGLIARYGRIWLIGMALFAVVFQSYLTWIEARVLEKWCQWCVTSFVVVCFMLIIAIYRQYDRFAQLRK